MLRCSLNKWVASICVSVVIVLAQIIVTQSGVIAGLRTELDIARAGSRLAADQIADMTYELSKLRDEREMTATQNFVAGVTALITRHNDYEAVWHSGYDRGVEVQQYVNTLDADGKTKAYTDEKK